MNELPACFYRHVTGTCYETRLSDTAHKWAWMMVFCKEHGLPPAQAWAWHIAECNYNKQFSEIIKGAKDDNKV